MQKLKTPAEQSGLLLQIAEEDNVYVLMRPLAKGDTFHLNGRAIVAENSLGLGHKIAVRDITAGEKIIKYGAPIGSAVCNISLGEHVHLHNIKSDYIPTYTLEPETV